MVAEIIDGKKLADELIAEVGAAVKAGGLHPALSTILVGSDPASESYIRSKMKACAKAGIVSDHHALPDSTTQQELLSLVKRLDVDPSVNGILVQLPLPKHIDENAVIAAISPEKDVDGYTAENLGRILYGDEHLPSCTPAGIIYLLEKSGVKIEGARAVVIGRSVQVGRPLAAMLLNRGATITICHSKTRDIAAETCRADILCVAVGKPGLVTGAMLKPGATVVDVGINRVDGKLVGDVDFASAKDIAGKITPVPGGVGPMTVAYLMKNTLKACEGQTREAVPA